MRSGVIHHFRLHTFKYMCSIFSNGIHTTSFNLESLAISSKSLKQFDNSKILEMLSNPPSIRLKPFIYKECYKRIPELRPDELLQVFKQFVEAGVPPEVCLKITQVIGNKIDSFDSKQLYTLLYVIYRNKLEVVQYLSAINCVLEKIDTDLLSVSYLTDVWAQAVDPHSSIHHRSLLVPLLNVTLTKLRELSDSQMLEIMTHLRASKVMSTSDQLLSIHDDIITNRRERHDIMTMLILTLSNCLFYSPEVSESFLEVIRDSMKKGSVTSNSVALANALAKQNFVDPKICEDLEPYVIQFSRETRKFQPTSLWYLYSCAIADYFPKRFIKEFLTADLVVSIIDQTKKKPFLKSGAEICVIVEYARVRGVDLGLSEEVQQLVLHLAHLFCKVSWKFHRTELNPWEDRCKSLFQPLYPIYVSWPTRAGYFIDLCFFFDKQGRSMSLPKSASILSFDPFTSYSTFDRFGVENKPKRSKANFDEIWDLTNDPDILKEAHTKIVVEFNGPFHFLKCLTRSGGGHRVDGPTMLRRKYLQTIGWHYIGVPYFQYEVLSQTSIFTSSMRNLVKHIVNFDLNKHR